MTRGDVFKDVKANYPKRYPGKNVAQPSWDSLLQSWQVDFNLYFSVLKLAYQPVFIHQQQAFETHQLS